MTGEPDPRSIGDLLADLSRQSSELVRKEVTLLRVELDERIDRMELGLIAALAGGGALAGGLMVLLFAAVFGLASSLPLWAAALVVGVISIFGGLALLWLARKRLSLRYLRPDRAIAEAKATQKMIKEELL